MQKRLTAITQPPTDMYIEIQMMPWKSEQRTELETSTTQQQQKKRKQWVATKWKRQNKWTQSVLSTAIGCMAIFSLQPYSLTMMVGSIWGELSFSRDTFRMCALQSLIQSGYCDCGCHHRCAHPSFKLLWHSRAHSRTQTEHWIEWCTHCNLPSQPEPTSLLCAHNL